MKDYKIRISGSGGQGILLMGIILAEAAISEGMNALQSQSYGPEARGGASKCEVIISNDDIDYPKIEVPNVVIALTDLAAHKYLQNVTEDVYVIIDEAITLPQSCKAKEVVRLPVFTTAIESVGKSITANIVLAGAFYELTKFVSKEALLQAVLNRIPKGTEDLNIKAIEAGIRIAKEVSNDHSH